VASDLPINWSAEFEPVRAVWREAGWPGVEESTSYGTPALKVRGKLLLRLREPGIVVLMCALEEKEFLMSAAPDIYFQVPHYYGYPAILARVATIPPDELADRIERAWRQHATKKMIDEYDAAKSPS
jgi:hypothetical protein